MKRYVGAAAVSLMAAAMTIAATAPAQAGGPKNTCDEIDPFAPAARFPFPWPWPSPDGLECPAGSSYKQALFSYQSYLAAQPLKTAEAQMDKNPFKKS